MFRKLKSLLIADDPNPQPSPLDLLDRSPVYYRMRADDDLLAVARGAGVLRDRRVDATAAALVQYATTDDAAGSMATFRRMGGAA